MKNRSNTDTMKKCFSLLLALTFAVPVMAQWPGQGITVRATNGLGVATTLMNPTNTGKTTFPNGSAVSSVGVFSGNGSGLINLSNTALQELPVTNNYALPFTNRESIYIDDIADNSGLIFVELNGTTYAIFVQTNANKLVLGAGRISLSLEETGTALQLGSALALHNIIKIEKDGDTMLSHMLNFYMRDGVTSHYLTLRGGTNGPGSPVLRFYSPGIDYVQEATTGQSNLVFEVSSNSFTINVQFLGTNGAAAAPAYSFAEDPDTGIYRKGANQLGFVTFGIERGFISSSGTLDWSGGNGMFLNHYSVSSGSAAGPSYSFLSDTDSGLFRTSADNIGIAAGGTQAIRFTTGVTTVTNLVLASKAEPPTIPSASDGTLWNSNKTLYWVTTTKTNSVSDGN